MKFWHPDSAAKDISETKKLPCPVKYFLLQRILNFSTKSATEIFNKFHKADVNMMNKFAVLTIHPVTSLTEFVIYCGSPYEFISDCWINDRISVRSQCKKKYPIDFRNVQARNNAESFHRSSVIKRFVLQIDRGGQGASLYRVADV